MKKQKDIKMKTYKFFLIPALLLALFANAAQAQELSAREIMDRNDAQRRTQDEQSELTMELINKKGKKRVRKVSQLTKTRADGNENSLIRFLAPADVRGTGLLTHEQSNRDDDQWLYLPALKKIRRISASDKSDSFMGTDFAFEDLQQEELDKYQYTLLRSEELDGQPCYVVEAIPTDAKEKKVSGYSKRIFWIRKDNFLAVQIHFYDKKNDFIKIFNATDIREIGDSGKWRAHRITMENRKSKHKTVLLFENYRINEGLADKFFTRRYLERGR